MLDSIHRRTFWFSILLLCGFLSGAGYARDLSQKDPERKRILDAVHGSDHYSHLANDKFVVKKIWASQQYAYLCAMVLLKDGTYQATDEMLDLYQIILTRQGTTWVPTAELGAFAESPGKVNCNVLDESDISDELLKKAVPKWQPIATPPSPKDSKSEICPVKSHTALHYVDVFDGAPESLATLVPDEAKETKGYWALDYVYKAGRFVTIRCRYADGQTTDVKLTTPVSRCDYTRDSKKTLKLECR